MLAPPSAQRQMPDSWMRGLSLSMPSTLRGNHLSNTTCPTQVFFKSGESCSKLWWSSTWRTTHKTNEAALDKQLVALDKQRQ